MNKMCTGYINKYLASVKKCILPNNLHSILALNFESVRNLK